MITILFLACNPTGTGQLAIDEESREIDKSLRSAEYRDVFDIKSHFAVRVSDLQELFLRHKPDIVHFSGHGSPSSEIVLQDDTGMEFTVPPEALSHLFSQFGDDIHCVVLNACYSRKQAEAIAEHIDCVIGMDNTITDKAATKFSSAFYQALGYGRDIQSAFNLACNQIQITGLGEHQIPKFLSQNANVNNIILQPIESYNEVMEIQYQISDNLPSSETIAVDFIGRKEELSILGDWFKKPEAKLWVLAGYGGKGKTAVAYQFAVNVKNQSIEKYHIIQWLSAKRRRFVEGTIVYVDSPDFTDLETAIDKLLDGYGFGSETLKLIDEKKAILLDLLTQLPALLIVDDVDSLEVEAEDAISFFTLEVTKTPSKVLLTSRRALFGFGGITTQIEGFSREDGITFAQSRINLFGLNPTPFAPYLEKIVKITDGSPLYIEELLRLCRMGVGIKEAIEAWDGVDGDSARAYSLKREFELLGDSAKQVLLACCLNRMPLSVEEITIITGLARKAVLSAVDEIERLFLMPKPTVIKEAPRFDVNINARSLVIEVMKDTELYKKVHVTVRRLAGEIQMSGKRRAAISEYLRHSSTLMELGLFGEAEDILKEGLKKNPEDPDILAQLGKVYARWKPSARLTDAKSSFKRAAELKCLQEDMYHHWWSLECKNQEWASAVEAGESGLKQFPNSWILKYRAGYAHSRLGNNLKHQFQRDRARYQLNRARTLLINALSSINLSDLDSHETEIHSDIQRCLVINSETLGHIGDVKYFLKQWLNDHPDDDEAMKQKMRLEQKFDIQIT